MSQLRRIRFSDRILEILKLIVLTKNFSFEYLDEEFSNNQEARYSVERSLHRMSMIANILARYDFHLNKDLGLNRLGSLEKLLNNPYKSVNPEILLKTIEELNGIEKNIRNYLGNDIPEDFPKVRSKFSVLKFEIPENEKFDSELLENEVSDFLVALSDFQRIISHIKNEKFDYVEIISIVRNNPLNVNFKDGLEAVKLLLEYIIPWKRNHTKQIANLTEEEKEIQIEKLKLENEKIKFEIAEKKVKLALEIVEKLNPNMNQLDTTKFATMLMEPLGIMTESKVKLIETNRKEE